MGIYKISDIAEMDQQTLQQKLDELKNELNVEKGISHSGGKGGNSGKIREIKKTIARILTVLNQKGFKAEIKLEVKAEKKNAVKTQTKKVVLKKKGEISKNE